MHTGPSGISAGDTLSYNQLSRVSVCMLSVINRYMYRVGQNHIYTSYMTVYLVIFLPKIPYIHRIYIRLWPTLYIKYVGDSICTLLVCLQTLKYRAAVAIHTQWKIGEFWQEFQHTVMYGACM